MKTKILSLFIVTAMVASLFGVAPAFATDDDLATAVNAAATADEVKAALKIAIEGGTVVDANYKKVENDKLDDVLNALIGKNFADDAAVVAAFNTAVADNYNPAIAEIHDFDDPIKGEFANEILTNGTYVTGTHEGYTGTYFKATSGLSSIMLENAISGDRILDVYIDAYTEVWGKNDISSATSSRYDSHGLWISKTSTGVTGDTYNKPYVIIGNSKSHTNKKNVIQQPDSGNSKTTINNPSWHTEDLELVFEDGLPISQTLKINGSAVIWQEGGKGVGDSDGDGTSDLAEALDADATTYPFGLSGSNGNTLKIADLKYVIYNCKTNWSDDYSKSYVRDFNITLYKSLPEAVATPDATDSALSNAFALYKAKGVADIDACYEGTDCDREAAYAYLREYVAENPSSTTSQIEAALTMYANAYNEGGVVLTLAQQINLATDTIAVKNALKKAIEGGTVLDANYKKVDDDKFENVLNALIGKDFADDDAVIAAFSEAVNENYNRAIAEIHSFDDPILGEFANELLTNGTYVTGTHEGYTGKYFKATSGESSVVLESAMTGDKYVSVYIDAYTEVWGSNDISTAPDSRYDSHGLWISKTSKGTAGDTAIKPYVIIGNSKSHTNKKNVIQQPDSANSITMMTNPSWHTEELNVAFEDGLPKSQTLKINGTAIEWQDGKGVGDSDGDGTTDLTEALAADSTTYPFGLSGGWGNTNKIADLKYVIYNCNSNWSDEYSKSYIKDFEVTVYYPLYQMINQADTEAEVEELLNFYTGKNIVSLDTEDVEAEVDYDNVYASLAGINNFQSEDEFKAAYIELCYENMDLPDYEVEIELCNSEGVKVYNYSAGDTLVANLRFKNNTDTARDIAFIAAVYDKGGLLVKANMPTEPVIANGKRQITTASVNPELPENVEGTYIRLYVFDSSTLYPFCLYEQYTTSTLAQKALDGKKIIFIGNSFTYYGKTVIDAGQNLEEANFRKRFDDKGYFYQICKRNNADVTVTNWTWGSHALGDTFGDSCQADKGHDGHNHLADLKQMSDLKYDYVVIQPGSRDSAETIRTNISKIQAIFKEANPDVKFIFNVHTPYYLSTSDNYKAIRECIYDIAREYDLIVANWGELVADIINGNAVVENATQAYNKNTFIVSRSASDGYHPNMLTGYITTQMIYSAITGEKAFGEDYSFCTDTNIHSGFSVKNFLDSHYTYDSISPEDSEAKLVGDELTTFPEVFASKKDMRGIQKLIDKYME